MNLNILSSARANPMFIICKIADIQIKSSPAIWFIFTPAVMLKKVTDLATSVYNNTKWGCKKVKNRKKAKLKGKINVKKQKNCKFYILLVEKHRFTMFFLFNKPFCYERTAPNSTYPRTPSGLVRPFLNIFSYPHT